MPIYKIQKRSGVIVDFKLQKIENAIFNAFEANHILDTSKPMKLAEEVKKLLEERYNNTVPHVENIQDIVEQVLIHSGHDTVAKSYILYRAKRSEIRQEKKEVMIEVEKTMDEYLEHVDWRINENANIGYSIGGLILKNSEKIGI